MIRKQSFHDLGKESTFLWGARQTGKENEVTIETKSTSMVNPRHLKGLKSFAEEYKVRKNEKSPL